MQAGGKEVAAPHGHWGCAAKAKGGTGSVAAKNLDPNLDLDPNGARGPGEESFALGQRESSDMDASDTPRRAGAAGGTLERNVDL